MINFQWLWLFPQFILCLLSDPLDTASQCESPKAPKSRDLPVSMSVCTFKIAGPTLSLMQNNKSIFHKIIQNKEVARGSCIWEEEKEFQVLECSFTPKAWGQEIRNEKHLLYKKCPVRQACAEQKWLLREGWDWSWIVILLLIKSNMKAEESGIGVGGVKVAGKKEWSMVGSIELLE